MKGQLIIIGGMTFLLPACAPMIAEGQDIDDEPQVEMIVAQNTLTQNTSQNQYRNQAQNQAQSATQQNTVALSKENVPDKYKKAGLTEWWLAEQKRRRENNPMIGWDSSDSWSAVDNQRITAKAGLMTTTDKWKTSESLDYRLRLPNRFYFDAFVKNIDKSSQRGDNSDLRINELDFGFGLEKFIDLDEYILRLNLDYKRLDINQVSGGDYPDRIVVPMIDFGFGVRHPKTGVTARISYAPFVDGMYDMNGTEHDVDGYQIKLMLEVNDPKSSWFWGAEYTRKDKQYENQFDLVENLVIPFFGNEKIPGVDRFAVGFPISMESQSEQGFNARFGVQAKARWNYKNGLYVSASALLREASESNKETGSDIEAGVIATVGVKF